MSNQISHDEFQERYGAEVIPYNFDEGPYEGIRCPDCEKVNTEDEWEWVDTLAYEQEDGFDYEVTGVIVKCPNCGSETTFR